MEVGEARSVLEWAVRRALGGGPARIGGHSLVQRLRESGYAERTCRDPLPARKVKAAGTPAKTSSNGSKTSEPPKVMLSSVQPPILLTPAHPRLTNTMTRRAIAGVHIIPSST